VVAKVSKPRKESQPAAAEGHAGRRRPRSWRPRRRALRGRSRDPRRAPHADADGQKPELVAVAPTITAAPRDASPGRRGDSRARGTRGGHGRGGGSTTEVEPEPEPEIAT